MVCSNYTLNDTLCFVDPRKRFLAEYWQVRLRYEKLHKIIIKLEAGTLKIKPKTSIEILIKQESLMVQYLHMLEVQAEIEGINLNKLSTDPIEASNRCERLAQ